LAGVDDEVAVLAAADDEAILGDGLGVAALGHQEEEPLTFRRVDVAIVKRRRVICGLVVVAVSLGGKPVLRLRTEIVALVEGLLGLLTRAPPDEALELCGGFQHARGDLLAL